MTSGNGPYGPNSYDPDGILPPLPPQAYQRPTAPPPSYVVTGRATGKQILAASWQLLRTNKSLLALPFISLPAGLVAAAVLFVPGFFAGNAFAHDNRVGAYVGGALAVLALSAVSIFFQAALVIGAYQQADGYTPTLNSTLTVAWRMRGKIVGWALTTTTVGLAIRAIEERLGIFGKVVGFVAGVAWAIASFLVIPVVVAEGLGPFAALSRSAQLVRARWGTGLRTTLRFGLIQLAVTLPIIVVLFVGIFITVSGASTAAVAVGVLTIAIAILALIAAGTVFGAIATFARAFIYRYTVGLPIPVPAELMQGAFVPKRRR